jgi:hypothetical protein
MSTDNENQEMGATQALPEHTWLHRLVGEWNLETEMMMPDGSSMVTQSREVTAMFGDLWVIGEGGGEMPDGNPMRYRMGLGYDVTFKGYRGFMLMDVSSHLWKYEGALSADGNTMTLDCMGPDMSGGDGLVPYQDIIEILDENHRRWTSIGPGMDGEPCTYFVAEYTRA